MKKYLYKAKNAKGETFTGEVEGTDVNAAASLVRTKKGLIVVEIRSASTDITSILNNFKNRVSAGDVTNFTRQLATMINAGLPVTDSLSILRLQANPAMQPIVSKILADVDDGESLSMAFSKHPKIFSATYIALIKAGETGGVLDKVLTRLADNMEKDEEFKGKVKGAFIYPAIIVIGMVVVAFIMMVFVIPKLTSLYTDFGAQLPFATQVLVTVSNVSVRFWPIVLALIAAILFGLSSWSKTKEGKRKIDETVLKIPIFGELQVKLLLTELCRTLALMVGAGVPILEGLGVTAEAIGNVVLRDALRDVSVQIEKGFPIAYSFAKHPEAFPMLLSQMISVGEETGKMEDVLLKVSHIFEVESDQKVKALTAAIEPIIMIILGIGVGFLVVAIILPIYNLTSKF